MKNKYMMNDETLSYKGHLLHRIKALVDFNDVKAWDKGGREVECYDSEWNRIYENEYKRNLGEFFANRGINIDVA